MTSPYYYNAEDLRDLRFGLKYADEFIGAIVSGAYPVENPNESIRKILVGLQDKIRESLELNADDTERSPE